MNDSSAISLDRTTHVLGYSLTPITLIAGIGILFELSSFFGQFMSFLAIIWCTVSATRYFENIFSMCLQRYLIAYPVFLLYLCFALIIAF